MRAEFSPCGRYRYLLERQTTGPGATAIVMINPSTADATTNDATIRKLIGFGERNQWGRLMVVNLFALKSTDVRGLSLVDDPIGPENDRYLRGVFLTSDRVIVAWGPVSKQPRAYRGRWSEVMDLARGLGPVYSIGEPAKCGHPRHPLFLKYDSEILPWAAWAQHRRNDHAA